MILLILFVSCKTTKLQPNRTVLFDGIEIELVKRTRSEYVSINPYGTVYPENLDDRIETVTVVFTNVSSYPVEFDAEKIVLKDAVGSAHSLQFFVMGMIPVAVDSEFKLDPFQSKKRYLIYVTPRHTKGVALKVYDDRIEIKER